MTNAIHQNRGGSNQYGVAGIFLVAIFLRSLNVWLLARDPQNFFLEDAHLYWPGGGYLAATGNFDAPPAPGEGTSPPGSERVPLYLLYIGGVRLLFGDAPLAAIMGQALIDGVTCVLIALLGGMISKRVGLIAGTLAAIWPNLIVHSASLLSDTLFLMVFTAMLVASACYLTDATPRRAGWAGLLCGLSIMTRTVTQFFPLALTAAAPAIAIYQRKSARTTFLAALLVALGSALPVAPWLARNVVRFNTWELTTQKGSHLTNWVLPLIRQAQDGTPHEVAAREIEGRFFEELRTRGIEPQDLPPFERSRAFSELALGALVEMPASAIAKAWMTGAVVNLAAPAVAVDPRIRRDRKGSFYNDPSPGLFGRLDAYLSTFDRSTRAWIAGALGLSALSLALQAYGFLRLAILRPWAALFACLVILYFLLVTGPIVSPKYRLPIEPILIVFTALGLDGLYRHVQRWRESMPGR